MDKFDYDRLTLDKVVCLIENEENIVADGSEDDLDWLNDYSKLFDKAE